MIDIRELRIGNYIESGGVALQIDAAHLCDLLTSEYYLLGHTQIPITPEWLERLGFEKGGYGWEIQAGTTLFLNIELDGTACIHYGCIHDGADATNPILYVHQLQNLFHSLTGQELTIKQ